MFDRWRTHVAATQVAIDPLQLRTAALPRVLWIELTSRCPFDCVFCSRKLLRGAGKHLDFACEMTVKGTPQLAGSLPMTITPVQGNDCALGSLGGYNHEGARLALRYLATRPEVLPGTIEIDGVDH